MRFLANISLINCCNEGITKKISLIKNALGEDPLYHQSSNSYTTLVTPALQQHDLLIVPATDYGRPMKPFASKSQTFGLGQTIGQINFGAFFGQFIRTHFDAVSPLSMFSINQPLFLQKTKPFIDIPNIYLGLGFEFGLQ